MVSSEKLNVSGPKKRKTLQSVRLRAPEQNDDIIASQPDCLCEQLDPNFSRESSVSRSQSTCEQEDLIDSDNSLSDDIDLTDDMEERSGTPVPDASIHNTSEGSRRSPLNQIPISGRSSVPPNADYRHVPESAREPYNRGNSNGNGLIAMGVIVALFLIAITAYVQSASTKSVTRVSVSVKIPTCEAFYQLEERYTTIDETLWDLLNVNVRRATAENENRQPGTFLFLHYGPTVVLDGLINSVSNITAGCFGGSAEPITLDGKYFKHPEFRKDYGVILAKQKDALLQRGVMVVRNFEEVPAWAAQAFHTICDTEEPLVDRAVIYLTLDMLKASHAAKPPGEQSATEEAEKLLHALWKDSLGPAVLGPLITRLTENVYRIV